MPDASPREPRPRRVILRRTDQAVLAAIGLASLLALSAYWLARRGGPDRLIEIDRADPRTARFVVDINRADWPELIQLPEVGETLARRIVDSRRTEGPFRDNDDLRRVPGIGPKTLDRIRPYLRPLPADENLVGP